MSHAQAKIIKITRIVEMANAMMASDSPHISQEWKNGVGFLLSTILHETGNYNGFSYLPSAGVTGGGTSEVAVKREYDRKYHIASNLNITSIIKESPRDIKIAWKQ